MLLLLVQDVDIFVWSPYDMPGEDPEFITHKLNMDLVFPRRSRS